jgi:hypothetical protein
MRKAKVVFVELDCFWMWEGGNWSHFAKLPPFFFIK